MIISCFKLTTNCPATKRLAMSCLELKRIIISLSNEASATITTTPRHLANSLALKMRQTNLVFYFRVFNHHFLHQRNLKMLTIQVGIRWHDSNSQPFGHESAPSTYGPGFQARCCFVLGPELFEENLMLANKSHVTIFNQSESAGNGNFNHESLSFEVSHGRKIYFTAYLP